jgi:hypothetical protein
VLGTGFRFTPDTVNSVVNDPFKALPQTPPYQWRTLHDEYGERA